MNKAVFLDRDGVINEVFTGQGRPVSPSTVEEFRLLPGTEEALTALKAGGYLLFVITNQPEVARGTLRRDDLDRIHRTLSESLPVDQVYVCTHDDDDQCECRKPKPGLILQAAEEWDVDLARSYMVGDRWKDVEAGARAGCTTILVKSPFSEERPDGRSPAVATLRSDYTASGLLEASEIILSKAEESG
jgi:D-glycero-D-manno-heptose 1,7-bisphosphate phosphatase